jgi:6-phosphogluconate dehydrogenase
MLVIGPLYAPRGDADYVDRLLSAMRKQFGGHDAKTTARG